MRPTLPWAQRERGVCCVGAAATGADLTGEKCRREARVELGWCASIRSQGEKTGLHLEERKGERHIPR